MLKSEYDKMMEAIDELNADFPSILKGDGLEGAQLACIMLRNRMRKAFWKSEFNLDSEDTREVEKLYDVMISGMDGKHTPCLSGVPINRARGEAQWLKNREINCFIEEHKKIGEK